MRGPSRATARPAWVAPKSTRGPLGRSCPKCPAEPFSRCIRWVVETWRDGNETHHGAGRWEALGGWHTARQTPGSAVDAVRALLDAERVQCSNREQHGYHWTDADERRTWCRGRTRT